jgi:uncharacterized integral membrane protein
MAVSVAEEVRITVTSTPPPDEPGDGPVVPPTRTDGVWIASVLFAGVLLLLPVFILQNTRPAEISFFGARARPPVGVALLLAGVFGVLLVALPSTARILQLRFLARRRARVAFGRPPGQGPAPWGAGQTLATKDQPYGSEDPSGSVPPEISEGQTAERTDGGLTAARQ